MRSKPINPRRCQWIRTGSTVLLCLVISAADKFANAEDPTEFFEKQVRPLLVKNCFNCHSAETNSQGGLRVDDRQGLIVGGRRGPAIVPGKPEASLLMTAISHPADGLKMPPEYKLADAEIETLKRWVAEGAAWTKVDVPEWIGKPNESYDRLRKEHWSWQPLKETSPPQVSDASWPLDDLDRFVLAQLESQNLKPVTPADKLTLIRRVTYDLTGLPPSPADISQFLSDVSPKAYETLIDRLLASEAFGERWGRHWLDVARFGESTGSSRNLPMPHSWRYRDYVIEAFNRDKPYDLFLREQIAGDLLPANSPRQKSEQLIATGFLAIGVKDVNQRFKVRFIMDNVDEQIDTVSRAILGLTVSCARCHDHKFDPIPTTDYYALAGIFRSTDLCAGLRNKMGGGGLDYYDPEMLIDLGSDQPSLPTNQEITRLRNRTNELRSQIQKLDQVKEPPEEKQAAAAKKEPIKKELDEAQKLLDQITDSGRGLIAFGVRDSATVSDTEIRIRGEAEQLGPVIPRGFLGLLPEVHTPPVNPQQSGRLELAAWLTSPDNPLTSRVIVNRIWQHLFSEGLVTSVDNFGVTGSTPSHPELLDHLALRFVRNGWSLKKTIRSILLSHSYQLSVNTTPENLEADPMNRWTWRHSPRRLDAEEIRDSMLAASGLLDRTRPKGSTAGGMRVIELNNNGPEARRILEAAAASVHRSIYLPQVRGITPTSLDVFDYGDQGMVNGQRARTTVAPQALYLLNDPFVEKQSLSLAERLLSNGSPDDLERVTRAYWMTVARAPTNTELDRALQFLSSYQVLRSQHPSPETIATTKTVKAAETTASNSTEAATVPDKDRPAATAATATAPATDTRLEAWAAFCQALFSSAEFRFVK